MTTESRKVPKPYDPNSPEYRVKATMMRLGMTAAELARITGFSISCINKTIQGLRKGKAVQRAIEQALGAAIWSTELEDGTH